MKDKKYSDKELFGMIKEGERQREKAIAWLMEHEKETGRVAKPLHQRGALPGEFEEVFDDALVALIMAVTSGRFEEGRDIWAYVYKTAEKIFYKLRRKPGEDSLEPALQVVAEEATVEEDMIRREDMQRGLRIFRKLSEQCQKILSLAFNEGKTNEEIANILRYKSKGVVAVKKSECLKKLSQLLRDEP